MSLDQIYKLVCSQHNHDYQEQYGSSSQPATLSSNWAKHLSRKTLRKIQNQFHFQTVKQNMHFHRTFDGAKINHSVSTPILKHTNTNSMFNFDKFLKRTTQTYQSYQKKNRKDSTDYKMFKEKQHIGDQQCPLSCFELISIPQPKLFVSLEELNKINFSMLSFTISELTSFSKLVIESSLERHRIGKTFNLTKLIELIAQNYNAAAYHNFTHAFSLMLLLYQCYNRSSDLQKLLSQKQWFYVFIAALAHDLDHPGTTNAFEVKRKSQLALEAGNVSVLEKRHLHVFWSIVKNNSQVNFLQGYTSYQSSSIKEMITRVIFATDVAYHFKNLETLQKLGQKEANNEQRSMVIVENLFHACDVGNPCLDFKSYMNWAALVSYEFNNVAVMEQKLGLEVTSYLKYGDINKFYAGQVGFCQALVYPLWKHLAALLPGLHEFQQNIQNNVEELQRRKKGKENK